MSHRRPGRLVPVIARPGLMALLCTAGAASILPAPTAAAPPDAAPLSLLPALQAVTGSLTGHVVDSAGAPLTGVTVRVAGDQRQRTHVAGTDDQGRFRFARLAPGAYTVEVRRIGYRALRWSGVLVELGRTMDLAPTTLSVEPVALPVLEVDARRAPIDVTRASLGTTLRTRRVRQLPVGRTYDSMLPLLPQAHESFLGDPVNVAGSTGLENAYYVEGVDVTDVYRGRGGTALPFELVDAVEVIHGGYEAEHGRALGGIVNVVTRSGGDELRARAFGTWTGSAVASQPTAVPGVLHRTSFREYDVGVTVSGPVVRGRAWFFTAYSPSLARADVELQDLGPQDTWSTRHRFAAKLDGRVADDTDVTLTVFGDPSRARRIRPSSSGVKLLEADPVLNRHREGGANASLRASTVLGDRLLLEAVAARHTGREDIEGATAKGRAEPTLIDRRELPGIRLSGGNQSDQALDTRRTSLALSASLFAGDHALKAGLELQDRRLDVLVREDPGQITRLEDHLWQGSFLVQDFTVRNRITTAYVQDSWTVHRRWRLNLGLRWDGQVMRDQNGDVGQRIMDQLQPRLGFVWQPGEPGTQKVFGHVGRFHQQLALHWATLTLAGFDQQQAFYSVDPRDFPDAVDSVRVFSTSSDVRGGVDDLRGEHHDELVVGYERQVGRGSKVGIAGLHRTLGSSVTLAFGADGELTAGNPGRGLLAHLPASERTYTALELTVERRDPGLSLLASYVLSRSRGNYPGLYAADAGGLRGGSFGPNNDQLSYFASQRVNAAGPLPNDRTHVLKLAGTRAFAGGLTVGATFLAASGTPLSEFGRVPSGFNTPLFLAPRGSAGRSPAIWDLSLRMARRLPRSDGGRIVLDLLHLGNPRTVVRVDQRRFSGARGSPFAPYEELVENQRGERPAYGAALDYQPPFALRLGVELGIGRD